MQKAIAKYGLAAHLAILAVAPLFLFPFFGDSTVAVVLLWLALPAAVWTFMQPSVRRGEMLHNARERVSSGMFHDPFLWVMLVVVVFTGLRALNSGIAMAYDAETSKWYMASPVFPLMPASVKDAGLLPFATTLASMVIALAGRHALGRSARQAYFVASSSLAGVAAAVAIVLANLGNAAAVEALKCPYKDLSFVGVAFLVHFVGSVVAVAAAIENRWNRAMPVLIASVGGTAAGSFVFSPAHDTGIFLVAWAVVFAYAFFYSLKVVKDAAEFKMLIVLAVSLASGWALAFIATPGSFLASRSEAFASQVFFPDWFAAARRVLSAVAIKAWMANPWTGTGVGSFALDIRFNASPSDWASIPRGLVAPSVGWLKILTERGIAGAAMMALPLALMLVTYCRRLVGWLFVRTAPQPGCWAGPAVVLAVAATGFFDCSFMRADVLMAVVGALSISASTFPKAVKGGNNG